VYRILGIPFVHMSHSVESLPIHLPSRQHVFYRGDADAAARREENSKLLGYFRLNAADPFARTLLYQELVPHYS